MLNRQIALLLLFFAPLELLAQRYGRPDSAQNYGRVQNPQLLLQVKIQKKRAYFRTSDLRKGYAPYYFLARIRKETVCTWTVGRPLKR